jgi:hypothetical protein
LKGERAALCEVVCGEVLFYSASCGVFFARARADVYRFHGHGTYSGGGDGADQIKPFK